MLVRIVTIVSIAAALGGCDGRDCDCADDADVGLPDVSVADVSVVTIAPACAVGDGGGGGSCVTIDADVACNPVTNEGCNADAGEACDFALGGFRCWAGPPGNSAALCTACEDERGPACGPTTTCVVTSTGSACAKFCCTDDDCAPGRCDTTTLGTAPVGVCVE